MPQTLLALLALTLATAFTFSSYQRYARVERNLISIEMGEMAGAVAKEVMQTIAINDFGDGVFGDGSVACSQFGGVGVCNDLDDFHDQNFLKNFELSGSMFSFDVDVSVTWRDPANRDSVVSIDSGVQAVEVTVYDRQHLFLPGGANLERFFE